jgi:hypothetical protein
MMIVWMGSRLRRHCDLKRRFAARHTVIVRREPDRHYGFAIEAGTVHECGCAVSARRRDMHPLRKAA